MQTRVHLGIHCAFAVPRFAEGARGLPSKRLEDRIYTLVARAVDATDDAELEKTVAELQAALKQHIARMRNMAASRTAPPNRRANNIEK